LNTDVRKFESSQKDESRAQLADSSKAYRKRKAFYCSLCLTLQTNGLDPKKTTFISHIANQF